METESEREDVSDSESEPEEVEPKDSLPNWYNCVVCHEIVPVDAVKRLPCHHLICGPPRKCFKKICGSFENINHFIDDVKPKPSYKRVELRKYQKLSDSSESEVEPVSSSPRSRPRPIRRIIACKSKMRVIPKIECPCCHLYYYEKEDIDDGNEEGFIARVVTEDRQINCFCGQLAKFHCDECKEKLCNSCYEHHQAIPRFKTNHCGHKIGEEVFKCFQCKKLDGQFVIHSIKNFEIYCEKCKADKKVRGIEVLMSWQDYAALINNTYNDYIQTLDKMEIDANHLIGQVAAGEIMNSVKNVPEALKVELEKTIHRYNSELKSEDEKSASDGKCRTIISRARQMSSFFKSLMDDPCGIGIIKYQNFNKYRTTADDIIRPNSRRLAKQLKRKAQKCSELGSTTIKTEPSAEPACKRRKQNK